MKMICRSLVPPLPSEPNDRSTEVGLTSKKTLRILNTIKPVTRVFTAMDATKAVRVVGYPQKATKSRPCSFVIAPRDACQVARGDKLKSLQLSMKSL